MIKCNESKVDRVLRVIVGLMLLAMVFFGPETYFGLIGVAFVVSGLVGMCPLYKLFNINTNQTRNID